MRAMRLPWVWLLSLSFAGVVVLSSEKAQAQLTVEAQAQLRFNRGRDFFIARNFEGALTEFRAAVALVPSPNTRLYIARCLHELGRNAEAYGEYQRAEAEAADRAATEPRYAATRDAAHNEAAEIAPRLGRLTIRVANPPEGTTVSVGNIAVPNASWGIPFPADPGEVVVSATAPRHLAFRRTITVQTGLDAEIAVELRLDPNGQIDTPPPPQMVTRREMVGGGVRIGGAVVIGLGVASGVLGGVFGAMAQNRYTELRMLCGFTACLEPNDTRIAEGEMFQTVANVGIGVGIAAAVAGTMMVIFGGPREVVRQERASARRTTVTAPQIHLWGQTIHGGGWAGVSSAF